MTTPKFKAGDIVFNPDRPETLCTIIDSRASHIDGGVEYFYSVGYPVGREIKVQCDVPEHRMKPYQQSIFEQS
jgi:hypothetical protein